MPADDNRNELTGRLTQAVESLALQYVVAGDDWANGADGPAFPAEELLASLTGIRDSAAEAGYPDTSLLAAQLMQSAANSPEAGFYSALRDGLTHLQEALDRE